MKYFKFQGMDVSRMVLGAGDYGTSISQELAFSMMDRYCEAGGNMIDTAAVYGDWVPGAPKSASEKCVGLWLEQRPQLRDKVIVSTKGAHYDFATINVSRVRPECIKADINQSLINLRVPKIDLYWLHRDDPDYPVEPIMDALFEAVEAGKIVHLGASNWSKERIQLANSYAARVGMKGFAASQISYAYIQAQNFGGLLEKPDQTQIYFSAENGDEEYYRRQEVALFAYSSQANGYLTKVSSNKELPAHVKRRYDCEENRLRALRASQVAKEKGVCIEAVGLGYIFQQPYPVFAVVGPRTAEQFVTTLQAADIQLSDDEMKRLTV